MCLFVNNQQELAWNLYLPKKCRVNFLDKVNESKRALLIVHMAVYYLII